MRKIVISKNDLEKNLEIIREDLNKVENKNIKIIAVVKANGMGLDLIEYSKFLISNGIEILALAIIAKVLAQP